MPSDRESRGAFSLSDETEQFGLWVDVSKSAPDGRFVRGWAAVTSVHGEAVVDWGGDVLPIDVLREAVCEYMEESRVAKVMHKGVAIGAVIESVMVDDEFCEAHGITHGKRGWWVGMRIDNPSTQKAIVRGDFKGFSIGGRGKRIDVK